MEGAPTSPRSADPDSIRDSGGARVGSLEAVGLDGMDGKDGEDTVGAGRNGAFADVNLNADSSASSMQQQQQQQVALQQQKTLSRLASMCEMEAKWRRQVERMDEVEGEWRARVEAAEAARDELEREVEYLSEELRRERELSAEAGMVAEEEWRRRQEAERAKAELEREVAKHRKAAREALMQVQQQVQVPRADSVSSTASSEPQQQGGGGGIPAASSFGSFGFPGAHQFSSPTPSFSGGSGGGSGGGLGAGSPLTPTSGWAAAEAGTAAAMAGFSPPHGIPQPWYFSSGGSGDAGVAAADMLSAAEHAQQQQSIAVSQARAEAAAQGYGLPTELVKKKTRLGSAKTFTDGESVEVLLAVERALQSAGAEPGEEFSSDAAKPHLGSLDGYGSKLHLSPYGMEKVSEEEGEGEGGDGGEGGEGGEGDGGAQPKHVTSSTTVLKGLDGGDLRESARAMAEAEVDELWQRVAQAEAEVSRLRAAIGEMALERQGLERRVAVARVCSQLATRAREKFEDQIGMATRMALEASARGRESERLLFSLLGELSTLLKEHHMQAKNGGSTYNKYKLEAKDIEAAKDDLRQLVKYVQVKAVLTEKGRHKSSGTWGQAAVTWVPDPSPRTPRLDHSPSAYLSHQLSGLSLGRGGDGVAGGGAGSLAALGGAAVGVTAEEEAAVLELERELEAAEARTVEAERMHSVVVAMREAEVRTREELARELRAVQARVAEAEIMRQQVEALRHTRAMLARELEEEAREARVKSLEAEEVEGRIGALEATEAVIVDEMEMKGMRLREIERQFPRLAAWSLEREPSQKGELSMREEIAWREKRKVLEEVNVMREQLQWTQSSLCKSRQRLPELHQEAKEFRRKVEEKEKEAQRVEEWLRDHEPLCGSVSPGTRGSASGKAGVGSPSAMVQRQSKNQIAASSSWSWWSLGPSAVSASAATPAAAPAGAAGRVPKSTRAAAPAEETVPSQHGDGGQDVLHVSRRVAAATDAHGVPNSEKSTGLHRPEAGASGRPVLDRDGDWQDPGVASRTDGDTGDRCGGDGGDGHGHPHSHQVDVQLPLGTHDS